MTARTNTRPAPDPIAIVKLDGGTHTRFELNQEAVEEYAEAMRSGAKFPPVVIFFDGANYWLADGFHRYHASKLCPGYKLEISGRNGTLQDAIKYALGANSKHGLNRTNADKRKCAEIGLKEFSSMSDVHIAGLCGVSHTFIAKVRKESQPATDAGSIRTGADGKVRKMPVKQAPPSTDYAQIAADAVGVPVSMVHAAGHVKKEAPKLFQKVRDGDMESDEAMGKVLQAQPVKNVALTIPEIHRLLKCEQVLKSGVRIFMETAKALETLKATVSQEEYERVCIEAGGTAKEMEPHLEMYRSIAGGV